MFGILMDCGYDMICFNLKYKIKQLSLNINLKIYFVVILNTKVKNLNG